MDRVARSAIVVFACSNVVGAAESERVILDGPVSVLMSADPRMFPERWRSDPIGAHAEVLSEDEIGRSKTVLTSAMKKYAKEVLTENLDAIYVVHRLTYFGVSTSGTNSRRNIYIANRGSASGFTERFIEGVFHAEFSSILLRNFPEHLDIDAWKSINEPAFEYGLTGVQAVRDGLARSRLDAKLHSAGFLSEYAQSTVENDFNSVVKELFIGTPEFWTIVEKHERVRKKTELVIGFFGNIDPSFNEVFFRSLSGDGARSDPPKVLDRK